MPSNYRHLICHRLDWKFHPVSLSGSGVLARILCNDTNAFSFTTAQYSGEHTTSAVTDTWQTVASSPVETTAPATTEHRAAPVPTTETWGGHRTEHSQVSAAVRPPQDTEQRLSLPPRREVGTVQSTARSARRSGHHSTQSSACPYSTARSARRSGHHIAQSSARPYHRDVRWAPHRAQPGQRGGPATTGNRAAPVPTTETWGGHRTD